MFNWGPISWVLKEMSRAVSLHIGYTFVFWSLVSRPKDWTLEHWCRLVQDAVTHPSMISPGNRCMPTYVGHRKPSTLPSIRASSPTQDSHIPSSWIMSYEWCMDGVFGGMGQSDGLRNCNLTQNASECYSSKKAHQELAIRSSWRHCIWDVLLLPPLCVLHAIVTSCDVIVGTWDKCL